MTITNELRNLLDTGIHRIGEIEIQTLAGNNQYKLSHYLDVGLAESELQVVTGPWSAREISTYSEDGSYRFTKGQVNLKRGWLMILEGDGQLRQALDLFYPASLGLYLAQRGGSLVVENLRDKLNRQTGMYRFAKSISDPGAQDLVQQVCGPANCCAKHILWKLAPETPLDDSEASRFNGIVGGLPENEAIPLLCREACNHFVAECRRVAKAEFEQKQA
jgi:hypothetical protein